MYRRVLTTSVAVAVGIGLLGACSTQQAAKGPVALRATASSAPAPFIETRATAVISFPINGATLSPPPASLQPVTSADMAYQAVAASVATLDTGGGTPQMTFGLYTDPVLGGTLDESGNQTKPGSFNNTPMWVLTVPNVTTPVAITPGPVTKWATGSVYYVIRDSDATWQLRFNDGASAIVSSTKP